MGVLWLEAVSLACFPWLEAVCCLGVLPVPLPLPWLEAVVEHVDVPLAEPADTAAFFGAVVAFEPALLDNIFAKEPPTPALASESDSLSCTASFASDDELLLFDEELSSQTYEQAARSEKRGWRERI